MEKAKRDSLSIDRISDLPKDILHRILYFLSQEDVVRTSVLCKSWRYVWCTRPNLDFSDINFKGKDYSHHESVLLLDQMGPITQSYARKGNLSLLVFPIILLELPICPRWCNLGQNIPENIPFVRLRVLRLSNVSVENEVFEKIISSCPLLTTMSLDGCKGLKTIKLEKKIHKHLKHFTFINLMNRTAEKCNIEIDIPTLETIEIMGSKIRCSMRNLSILKTLSLGSVEQSPLYVVQRVVESVEDVVSKKEVIVVSSVVSIPSLSIGVIFNHHWSNLPQEPLKVHGCQVEHRILLPAFEFDTGEFFRTLTMSRGRSVDQKIHGNFSAKVRRERNSGINDFSVFVFHFERYRILSYDCYL
ncbi:PREDICTED: F-box/LRR-repeat protein 25-like [Erythranthe guttata]|uniref:F-box/LRR-repeat protein 25-like n=1 Tax=Erythranthe guttata TaxID=4155 RepID=UPI00064DDEF0|nr:PREDICTED: F-box/LRR-repeat protein 25-like [Erythranthe guttata]|eukprot:XP_012857594.1 PREDICTED: F-box/LRR-repeat protein 25-like [Erythranthe guttata]